jgi:hypothetical protein
MKLIIINGNTHLDRIVKTYGENPYLTSFLVLAGSYIKASCQFGDEGAASQEP